MGDEKHYFLELTEPQMETLTLVVWLQSGRMSRLGNLDLAGYVARLEEVHTLLAKAPTHITELPGFPSQIVGIMRVVE